MKLENLDEEFDQGFDTDAKKNKTAEEIRDLIMAAQQFIDSFAKENAEKRDDESANRDDTDDPHRHGEGDGSGVFRVDRRGQSNANSESVNRICNALEQNGRDGEFAFFFLFRFYDSFDAVEYHLSSDDRQKAKGDEKVPRANLVNEGRAQEVASKREQTLQSGVDKSDEDGLPNFEAFIYQTVGNRESKAIHRKRDAKQDGGSDPFHSPAIMVHKGERLQEK